MSTMWERMKSGLTRRSLFQNGSLLAAAQGLGLPVRRASAEPMVLGNIYRSIGVRPVINARGTFTIIGGSIERPEVRAAMDHASRHFVQIDELADAVGRRFAEITGAEWGMVSAGCRMLCAVARPCCGRAPLITQSQPPRFPCPSNR